MLLFAPGDLVGSSALGSTWNPFWVLSPIECLEASSLNELEWMGGVCSGDLVLSQMGIGDF